MAEIIAMPKLGFDMAEGTLVRWLKREGEAVTKGDILAEIETDKATVEVEASATGTVRRLLVQEGTAVPVGSPIAVLGGPDEPIESLIQAAGVPAAAAAAEPAAPRAPAEPVSHAAEVGGAPAGVRASPVARRIAGERGIPLTGLRGSGPGGRIVKKDVLGAVDTRSPAPSGQAVPLARLRAAIGRRMQSSKQQVPHFYLTIDLDAASLLDLRAQLNSALPEEAKLSVNDFIVKAAALALRDVPGLNASLQGDRLVRHAEVNVGVAVAVDEGLLTVVVRDADRNPLRQISEEARAMAHRARQGRVRPEDVEGSTFTVSNLGMYDIDHFVAIINPPEAAILAVGSVREVPVVSGGQLKPGWRMKATLSADHRVTDGAEAARWLQAFRARIERPAVMLL